MAWAAATDLACPMVVVLLLLLLVVIAIAGAVMSAGAQGVRSASERLKSSNASRGTTRCAHCGSRDKWTGRRGKCECGYD